MYNNDPSFGYQPNRMGGYGQMQPMYPQYQTQQDAQLFCRPVASADEARGVPVDFSGKPMIFPHLSAGKIYVKVFDPGNGSAVFQEYKLSADPAQETAPPVAFAPMSALQQLEHTIAELKEEIRTLKGGKRKAQAQEVSADEI